MVRGAVGAPGPAKWVRLGSTVARQVGGEARRRSCWSGSLSLLVLREARLVARRDWSRGLALGEAEYGRPNNSLQLTRLACGKLERALPARMRENG